jgi:hypothetical protein
MPDKFQVLRGDAVIGEHDEPTLLALLNAGSLRLSDRCRRDDEETPTTLADLVCRSSSRSRWQQMFGLTLLLGLVVVVLLASRSHDVQAVPAIHQPTNTVPTVVASDGTEIRRGVPVITGHIEFGDGIVFPRATVNQLASHSRVTVLGLDAAGSPCTLASGFVVDDGNMVVTSLSGVASATNIELHLPDGRIERPATVMMDREAKVAFFPLTQPGVALRWAATALDEGMATLIAGHALGINEDGFVLRIAGVQRGERRVHYQFSHSLPPSYAGSAVLDAAGDAGAILIDPLEGTALRAADVIASIKMTSHAEPIRSLASLPRPHALPKVAVIESQVRGSNIVTLLRNETGATVHKALLEIAYFTAPPEALIVQTLESQLREAAAQASALDGTDGAAARQRLREITTQHEAARQHLRAVLAASARHCQRRELHAIECDLAPGSPCSVALPADAGTGSSVIVTVLEVEPSS